MFNINEEPLLTVLLVTYNHIASFEKAINSVLAQKTNFAYKLIILDDASSDGTSDIVRKYSNYENVTCIIRDKNIGGALNVYEGLKSVKTKYYAILETDDYWCDENKLQTQVDILENNPDCSFCAHNTLVNYTESNKTKNYINSSEGKFEFPHKKLGGKCYIEPHVSSRVFRTDCLDLENIKDIIIPIYDLASNFYFLTKGKMYYIDKIMSVYNYSNNGVYSGVSPYQQRLKTASVIHRLNIEFNFKYNCLIANFFATRLNLNYFKYLRLRYTKDLNKLDELYKKELKKYKSDYLSNCDVKPILHFYLPISSKKKLVFEIRREKERV